MSKYLLRNTIKSLEEGALTLHENDKVCAPGAKFTAGSCIKLDVLVEMVKAYNKENPNDEIKLHSTHDTINPSQYKKYLLKELDKRLKNECTTQKCWTEQDFVNKMKEFYREELDKYTFLPDGPSGKFEWLNTLHINEVMEQYEKVFTDFKFMGAVPMDFDEFDDLGIRNFNYEKSIKNGKTKIGFVFNLDEHWQPGSHWVALYADLIKGQIYYFDSYAVRPEKRVRTLMRRIERFLREERNMKPDDIDCDYNKIRHQYKNSECGVYSINFILRLLNGESFKSIEKSKVPDEKMNKMRIKYFRIGD